MSNAPIVHTLRPTLLALALAVGFPAMAQTNAEVLNELKALRERVTELENKLKAAETKAPAAGQWGMTPEQARELNRVTVKAEALEDARDAAGLRSLKISGYMDPTFIYNKAQNRSGFQFLNKVDSSNGFSAGDGYNYDNSYFGAAVIDFQKETESGTRWRLTLAPNRGVGSVFDGTSPIHEASVSVPLSDLQTRFIAGQIPDWSGYEYLQPTLNKLITHNLLFDFTLPTAYTGAGMEITSGKWVMKGLLANLNASKKGNGNNTPVIAYRVDYSKGEFEGFGFAGVHGKAANFADPNGVDSKVNLLEVDGYFIRGDWTLQGQLSYGAQKKAAISPDPLTGELRDAKWTGFSTLVAYKFTPRFEGTTRFDYIKNNKNGGGLLGYTVSDDRNGIGPGWALVDDGEGGTVWGQPDTERGVNRSALTFGLSYLFDLNTTMKFEYRFDRASRPVFLNVKDGTYRKSNNLFGASVLVSF
jgi:Protein of unknown function (DUF3138)